MGAGAARTAAIESSSSLFVFLLRSWARCEQLVLLAYLQASAAAPQIGMRPRVHGNRRGVGNVRKPARLSSTSATTVSAACCELPARAIQADRT